jgi:hypothetical protein
MSATGRVGLAGRVRARVIRAPGPGLLWKLSNLRAVVTGLARDAIAQALGMNHMAARLYARLVRADGTVVDYGLVSCNLVTTAFVNYMNTAMQGVQAQWDNFNYHDSGTGTVAENITDTSMGTVITDNLRTVGTQTGATNTYVTVGTIAYTTTRAVTEHGVFNDTRANGGTLLDRSLFTAINVVSGDSIQFSYTLTISAGG